MTFFDTIYDKLFNKKVDENGVLSHQPLKRSKSELANFKKWLATEKCTDLIQNIHRSYHLKRTNIDTEIPILLFRSVYANGFAIKNSREIANIEYEYLLDYFKHQLIQLGYRQAGSDSKVTAKDGFVLSVDKFYMKPPLQTEPPIDQLYGNVSIELHKFNDQPNYLKIMASIYSDRLYKKHGDFDELIEHLLDSNAL